jgi:hypothetical protein
MSEKRTVVQPRNTSNSVGGSEKWFHYNLAARKYNIPLETLQQHKLGYRGKKIVVSFLKIMN